MLDLRSDEGFLVDDFEAKGGVVSFLTPYAPQSLQGTLSSNKLKIDYLDYNWNLNE